jgi:hypothetical protein
MNVNSRKKLVLIIGMAARCVLPSIRKKGVLFLPLMRLTVRFCADFDVSSFLLPYAMRLL